MSELEKIPESKMKIRFHDCDPFNHLNNSRYIDYMVTARGDQLMEHYDFDIYKLAMTKGLGWVSAQTQISYIVPAYPTEEVTIQTQLIDCREKSLLVEASMWNEDKTILKSLMWTKLVHFDLKTQSSCRHSDELMSFFRRIVNPLEADTNFELRVKSLKQSK